MIKINLFAATSDPAVKRIPLTHGQFALVDAADYQELSQYKWGAYWNEGTQSFYAFRMVRMSREILSLERDDQRQVDHKNHQTTDNRRSNIRAITTRQNHENRKNQSMYGPGVYKRRTKSGRFAAQVQVGKRKVHLGTFDTPQEARRARASFLFRNLEEVTLEDLT